MTPPPPPALWENPPRGLARALFEGARDAVLLIDAAGRVAGANPAAAALFGRPPTGADVRDLLEGVGPAPRGGNSHLRTAAGDRVPVCMSAVDLGEPGPYALLTLRDLRDSHRAERAEARYRNVLEGSLQGVLIHQDERIRYANPALARMFGYDGPEELVGRHLWDTFILPEHLPALRTRTAAILAGESIPPHPGWCAVGKDGRRLWVTTSASRIEWDGRPAVVAFYLDITARQRAEEELRQSEARLTSVIANSPGMAIQWFDADGRVVLWNRASEEMFGFTAAEALGRTLDRLIHTPEEFARFRDTCAEIARTGRPIAPTEYTFRRRSGEPGACLSTRFAIPGPSGASWFVCMDIDITARKRAEAERLRLEAQVLQAQKLESLGVLAGGIAHDFNNLLTSVLGYSGLAALELPLGSAARAMIGEIEKAATRAAELTGQMLAYSGRGKFVVRTVGLDELVREMHKLLLTVVSKKAVIRLDLAPVAIEADVTQIRQVVMNLLTNASDALDGRPGAIAVRSGARRLTADELQSPFVQNAPPGEYAFLEVEDTGCGMSEDTLAKIFDPFFTTKFTGRGLGLAAVLGIIRGHGGGLQIDTAPGRGTTFRVYLPCAAGAPPRAAPAPPTAAPRGSGRVLVVDDEENVRTLVRRVLEGAGFEVLTAADGLEALRVLRAHRGAIRVVLLDLTMPRLDGWEVAGQLRTEAPDLPVVMMSGYGEPDLRREALSNVTGFLEKPFRAGDLLGAVCRAAR